MHSKEYKRSSLIILMLFISIACAMGMLREPRFKTYSTEDGLSHKGISCILEDAEGFIWFGTWDGLNRFDGHHFTVYKSMPGDHSVLKNNKIRGIVEDSKGYLWVKTYDKKVYRFNKQTEEFVPIIQTDDGRSLDQVFVAEVIPLENGDVWLLTEDKEIFYVSEDTDGILHVLNFTERLPKVNRQVNFILEDNLGQVWLGTQQGMLVLAKNEGNYVIAPYTEKGNTTAAKFDFTLGRKAADGQLFFASATGNLFCYTPTSKTLTKLYTQSGNLLDMQLARSGKIYLTFQGQGLTTYDPLRKTIERFNIGESYLSMYEDRMGSIWLEPEGKGAVLFQPSKQAFRKFKQQVDSSLPFLADEGTGSNQAFRVFEDVNGLLWVCLRGGGFGYYDQVTQQLSYFYNDPADRYRRFSNNVVTAYSDKKGVLWFSTRTGGIHKATFISDNFQHQRLVEESPRQFDNEMRAMLRDSDGKVWLTNKRGKVYFRREGKLQPFVNDQLSGSIYCMMEDRKKNIWIGTKGDGLIKLEPSNVERTSYRVLRYRYDPKDIHSLSSDQIYTITEDEQGRIWIGTFQRGLNLLTEDNGKVSFKNIMNSFPQYPKRKFNVIRHAMLGPDHKIWLGTTDGLLRFDPNEDPEKMSFLQSVKIAGDKSSLGSNDVMYLFTDRNKTVWVGTFGGGLNKVLNNPVAFEQEVRFKSFTKRDGLPNDIVLSVMEDDQGHLWIATENGLASMDIQNEEFRNYNRYNGVPAVDFSEASCLKLENGELLFGTTDGYISFYPNSMVNAKFLGNMVFTGIQLYNTEIDIKDPKSPLQTEVNYADELVLNHDQNVLTIEYAVLDYRFPNDLAYAYILEGYDKDWHYVKNQQKATYTKLPPGDYTFKVKTVNKGYFENQPSKSLRVVVHKPWWLQAWAICFYILLLAVVLEFIRRTVYTMMKLKQGIAVEKRVTELKLQFFTNISHELRTPLTLLVHPLEKLQQTEYFSAKGNDYLRVINRNTRRMIRFVNQLLDFRKIQNEKLQLKVEKFEVLNFIRELFDNFEDLVADKHIKLQLSAAQEDVYVWADRDKMDIVFFNLIANAVKFSPQHSTITVAVESSAADITISIIDEGVGLEEKQLSRIFEPYYEGGNNQDKAFKGTGIGLSLSKDIVLAHHGQLVASKNEHVGLTFSVILLEGNKHFDPASLIFDSTQDVPSIIERREPVVVSPEVDLAKDQEEFPALLLVEDNPELRHLIAEEFEASYRVYEASNGKEGYELASTRIPDVIISDVMMPEMDGIEMLKILKGDLTTSHIPVILLTAKSAIEDQISGLTYGADFYITKPFHFDYVKHLLANLLKGRQQLVAGIVDKPTILKLEASEVVITSKDEIFLREVIEIIEQKMSDTQFHIDVVVQAMGIGRTTFYKKLKSLTNMSPVEFIKDIRLKRAKQLLDCDEFTVSEIAYRVGFNSSGYFSTCFKDRYGLSPTDYLKERS